ncbi:TMM59 protein, partial [Atractosteus spatula]|nr:TMM59 protein [Atractosteus spatula]
MVRHGGGVCGLPALVSVLLVGLTAASELFDSQLGDMNYCKQECSTKHKSSAKDAVLNACHRGCRLYSICQFVNGNAGYNASREECQGACQEAYGGQAEQEGCRTGYRSHLLQSDVSPGEGALAHRPQPSSSALDVLSTWCSDIISSAHSFISSTWTFYLQADDGKVVVFQLWTRSDLLPGMRSSARSGVSDARAPDSDARLLFRRDVGSRGEGHSERHGQEVQLSRRSGLPRWILAACLFLSVMVMLWLSCASLVTAPEQHVKTQLSINGDKEFLDDTRKVMPYPLTPVIAVAVGQSDEGEEAGPLLVKVDLDKTIL